MMTSVNRQQFLSRVEGYIGKPFAERGEGFPVDYATDPKFGMDCSGLVLRSLADVLGYKRVSDLSPRGLRSNNDIFSAHFGAGILPPQLCSTTDVRTGDIVCWYNRDLGGSFGHCAIVSAVLSDTELGIIHAHVGGIKRGSVDLGTGYHITRMAPNDVLRVLQQQPICDFVVN